MNKKKELLVLVEKFQREEMYNELIVGLVAVEVYCFPASLVRKLKMCMPTLLGTTNGFLPGHKISIHWFSPGGTPSNEISNLPKQFGKTINSKSTKN